MKKWTGLLLALLCAALVGCNGSPADDTQGTGPASSEQVRLATSLYGAFRVAMGTEGAYQVTPVESGGSLLCYIDYASKVRLPLCTRPECRHQDDTCTAWFPQTSSAVFLSADKSRLFTMTYADAVQKTPDMIWEISLDGQTRKELCRLGSAEGFEDAVASGGESLFFTARMFERDAQGRPANKKQLRAVNMNTGEVTPVTEYDENTCMVGAFENQLLFWSFQAEGEEGNVIYSLYDLATGEQKEVYRCDYISGGKTPIAYPHETFLYIVEPFSGEEDLARVLKMDLRTQEMRVLTEQLPFYAEDTSYVQGIHDGRLIIDITSADEVTRQIDHYRFSVNEDTGEITELTLEVPYGSWKIFMPIEGMINETECLVIGEYANQKIMIIGNDGDYHSAEVIAPRYAIMKKEDYWGNRRVFSWVQDRA